MDAPREHRKLVAAQCTPLRFEPWCENTQRTCMMPGVARVGSRKKIFGGVGILTMSKGQRKANGSFELAESPSHLMRRCHPVFRRPVCRGKPGRTSDQAASTSCCYALEHMTGQPDRACRRDRHRIVLHLPIWCGACSKRGFVRATHGKDGPANEVAIKTLCGRRLLRAARMPPNGADTRAAATLPAPEAHPGFKALALYRRSAEKILPATAKTPSQGCGRRNQTHSRRSLAQLDGSGGPTFFRLAWRV